MTLAATNSLMLSQFNESDEDDSDDDDSEEDEDELGNVRQLG